MTYFVAVRRDPPSVASGYASTITIKAICKFFAWLKAKFSSLIINQIDKELGPAYGHGFKIREIDLM